jgi:hypothetical protein
VAWILDAVGCSFFLLRRVCWPALEECYGAFLVVHPQDPASLEVGKPLFGVFTWFCSFFMPSMYGATCGIYSIRIIEVLFPFGMLGAWEAVFFLGFFLS